MTLVRSWNRGQRVQQAMVLRGFDGTFRSLDPEDASRGDWLMAGSLVALSVGFTLAGIWW